jgi:hypothetical protein
VFITGNLFDDSRYSYFHDPRESTKNIQESIKKIQSTEVLIFGIIETQITWKHDRCDKKKLSRRDELVEKVIGKKLFTGEKELLEIMKVITEPLSEELR